MATKKKSARRGKNGTSKSESIRQVLLRELGRDAAPKDVIARLATRNIKVSPAHVSNVKAALARKEGQPGLRPRKDTGDALSVNVLMDAKIMADKLGGIDTAKRALDVLARLR